MANDIHSASKNDYNLLSKQNMIVIIKGQKSVAIQPFCIRVTYLGGVFIEPY